MDGITLILLSLTFGSAMMSVVFLIAWYSFDRKPHALAWSVTFGLATIQWLGNLLNRTPDFFPNFLTYWLLVSGLSYIVLATGFSGYLLRAGFRVPVKSLFAGVLIAEGLTWWSALPGGHYGFSMAIGPICGVAAMVGAMWALYKTPLKKNGAVIGAIVMNGLFASAQATQATIGLLAGPIRDPEMSALYGKVLFLTLPTAFTGLGLFMVLVLAADLAEQVRDLSAKEQKRLKEKADQYWATLHDVIGVIPELVAIDDGKGVIVACNDQFAAFIGEDKDALLGQQTNDYFMKNAHLYHSVDGEEVDETGMLVPKSLLRALKTGDQLTVQMADGRTFVVDCAPIVSGGNIMVAHDVTEIKRLTLQLEEAIASMPLAFALFDDADTLVACNERMEELCQVEKEVLVPQKLTGLLDNLSNQLQSIDGAPVSTPEVWSQTGVLRAAVKSDASFLGELRDGRYFQFSSRKAGTGGCVFLANDLTNHKKMETELEGQRAALYQSEKINALGTLLAGVAHELNNPLTIVVANAHVMSMVSEDPELIDRVEKITAAAERCSKIVHSFLAMARKGQQSHTLFDMSECIQNTLNIVGFGFRQDNVTLECDIEKNLPFLKGDRDQIGQVVLNLLLNAQQSVAETTGQRRISLTCKYEKAENQIVLCVKDNGAGIDEEVKARIFEPFFTTKEVGSGTGLGLFLVKGIVDSHEGTIVVPENHQEGALFEVRLPVGADEIESTNKQVVGSSGEKEIEPQNVLVVDDEEDIQRVLRDILEHQGHSVHTETSGRKALEYLQDKSADIVITDLRMPEMSGDDIHTVLEVKQPTLAANTIVMTGDNLSRTAKQFLQSFRGPVLHKPFSPKDVAAVIRKLDNE
ncbi:MAG: ATP-binding protein [Kordiimonas sp.]